MLLDGSGSVAAMSPTLFAKDQRALTFATMSAIAAAAYNNLSVSAALPAIGDDLGKLSLLPWIVTIELIASAVAVLAIGPIVDAIGTRTVFRFSIVAFAVTCAACAFAPNLPFLIVARAAQGLTTGAIIANVMAAIGLGVPESLRARAYAANSSVWGVMGVGGPAIAALVLTVASWPAIFLVNLPVAAMAGAVGWNAFPGPTEDSANVRTDRTGLALVIAFTLLSLGALSTLAWWTPLAAIGSIATAYFYVRHARSTELAVLKIRHLAAPQFRLLHATAFLTVTSGICANTFLPVYVKGVRGATTSQAAFAVVFLTVGWTTGAFIASRVSELRSGESAVVVAACVLAAAGTITAVTVGLQAPLWMVFVGFVCFGMAMGGVSSAGVGVLQSKALPGEMGRVNSAHQFVRTLGFTYGAALSGSLIFVTVARQLGDADLVRDLLSDDELIVSSDVVDALGRGFTFSAIAAALLSYVGLFFALRLRSRSLTVVQESVRP